MPTPTKGPRLGGSPAHERLMLANLATALFEHGRITTTDAKARRLRPLAERLITKAKRGDLHARRQVLAVIRDKTVVHELFSEIGPRYAARPGGYTRIVRVGPRKGDNAPMAVIELVEALTVSQEAVGEAEAATKRVAKRAPAKAAAGQVRPADESGAEPGTGHDKDSGEAAAPADGAVDAVAADVDGDETAAGNAEADDSAGTDAEADADPDGPESTTGDGAEDVPDAAQDDQAGGQNPASGGVDSEVTDAEDTDAEDTDGE